MLGSLTVGQLHELWYILLREKNVINTEKYHHWKKGYVYNYTHDPEEVIAESMANIKDRLRRYNERAAVLNGEKGTTSILKWCAPSQGYSSLCCHMRNSGK